jgi:AraC-like DNA-binding protein
MDGSLVPAADIDELLAAPIDRYLVGASYVLWVQGTARAGIAHSAPALDPADFPALARGITLCTHPAMAERYDVYHDASHIRGADHAAFDFLSAWLDRWLAVFAHRVRRFALVRPEGVAGAALAGMVHQWIAPRIDARMCESRAEAYDFLAIDAPARRPLEELHAAFGPGPLRRLRELLVREPSLAIDAAATRLATSARSLQRALAAADTTYRDELGRARVRAATRRLVVSDAPVDDLATELGFATADAFTRAFERELGETPAAYGRRRSRGVGDL